MARRTFVILGAGLAGATAAATLRQEGFDGRLVLIGSEPRSPYERPPLSKGYLRGEQRLERIVVRPDEWFVEQEIDARFGETATAVVDSDTGSVPTGQPANAAADLFYHDLGAGGCVPTAIFGGLPCADATLGGETIKASSTVKGFR